MQTLKGLVMAIAAGCAVVPVAAHAAGEQVIEVPGFGDFLAVDGKTVWMTNRSRVEQWSRKGKLAEVPLAHPCGALTVAFGDLWVADCKAGTLNRIDRKTAKIITSIQTGIGDSETNVVAGAGSVWVASDKMGTISRIDPATNTVIATITADAGSYTLAFGFGAVWAVSIGQNSISKIDPVINTVVKHTALGEKPGFLAAGEGAVWVQEQGDGTLARIDPASGEVTGRVKVGASLKYGDIDTGGGMVWLRTTDDQTFAAIDAKTLAITARVGKADGSGALRYTKKGVWTSAHDAHSLTYWPKPPQYAK
ncbi:YncE family protein [Novosphingobium sp.]|uniref:Vgb family protein n=1 Tax=Novosphingobium sp. TaxID=1874826 RepID=UPI0025EE53BE|nr:YncE family protein [Novosphingobium sp.]